MVENVVRIKSEIMIDVGNSAKKHHIYEKYIWNSTTCSCENRKYLASIVDKSVITCHEIIDVKKLFQ